MSALLLATSGIALFMRRSFIYFIGNSPLNLLRNIVFGYYGGAIFFAPEIWSPKIIN